MKPIVVSAARAVPAPKAEPNVSAAPPCNRCRREILPNSMCLLPLADGPPHISQPRRYGGAWRGCRNLRARACLLSIYLQDIEYIMLFSESGCRSKFVQELYRLIFRRHSLIVCKAVKQLLGPHRLPG